MKVKKLLLFFSLMYFLFTAITLANPKIIIKNQSGETLRIIRPLNTHGMPGLPNPFIQADQTVEINLDKIPAESVYPITIETSYNNQSNSYFIMKLAPISNGPDKNERYDLYIYELSGKLYPEFSSDDEKTFKVTILLKSPDQAFSSSSLPVAKKMLNQ